jgi:type VI secretion system protein ImpH
MLGPNGSLPLHVSELVRERVQTKRDHTLAHFLDLFHHRAFSHIYRAWAQAQSAAGLDRPQAETFTRYVARLAGDEPDELQSSQRHPLSPHARWATAAHRIRAARNPEGLVYTLQHFFGVPVQLHEYQLHWMPLEPQDQSHVGRPRASSLLGQGAIAGQSVPDRQSKFRLVIGPLSLNAYLRLTPAGTPQGSDLAALIEMVRAFIGFEYVWEVQLRVQRPEVQTAQLGGTQQLGWSTWLEHNAQHTQAIEGLVMEPEAYAKH